MIKSMLALLLASAALAQSPPPQLKVWMVSLGVTDMERAIQFYGDTLGLAMVGGPGEVTLFDAGDVRIALNRPLGDSAADALVGALEVVFAVSNVADSQTKLAERGCNFVATAREVVPGLWAATFTDPDGHRLTILGPR
jgi:predicted enzyme related to lactoylglutathione lyase